MASKQTTTTTYTVAALPTTSTQYRMGAGSTGTAGATAYAGAMRALAGWARGTAHAGAVHALVHLGWCAGSGARATNRASNSAACKHAAAASLPAAQWAVGAPAAPQLVANMQALAEAGAPAPALATVWATYTGGQA